MSQTALVLNAPGPLFETGSATHVGNVRDYNEDNLLARPEAGIWAVADGMGGHDAGDLASATVIEALRSIEPADSAAQLLMSCERRVVGANAALIDINQNGQRSAETEYRLILNYELTFAGKDRRLASLVQRGATMSPANLPDFALDRLTS